MYVTLSLVNVSCRSVFGVYPKERQKPQTITISADITYHYRDTYLDHVLLAKTITETITRAQSHTMEEAAQLLAQTLLKRYPAITRVTLTVAKPDYPSMYHVSVTATMRRSLWLRLRFYTKRLQ